MLEEYRALRYVITAFRLNHISLGASDTLRTHVEGVLRRRPDWEPELIGYQVESACMVGKWEEVQQIVTSTSAESSSVLNAKVLLAMRSGDEQSVSSALSEARKSLGAPIIAAGSRGYRRSYEAALDLHLLHELRVMHDHLNRSLNSSKKRPSLAYLDRLLATRLESIQPSFRFREPIISLRRTALALRWIHCFNHMLLLFTVSLPGPLTSILCHTLDDRGC